MLPLGDSPNPPGTPVATYALIAANVALYLLVTLPLSARAPDPNDPMVLEYLRVIAHEMGGLPREAIASLSVYDLFVFRHGYQPGDPSVVDLFFSMFLHGGLMHLFGNMLFLWIYGDNVEHRLGAIPYVIAYLATGVAATMFFSIFSPDSRIPMVGASGAISGVLGCYFVWFPHNKVRVLLIFGFFVDVVMLPARVLLGIYLFLENVVPFLVARSSTGVAYGAHIGGFIAGWVLAKWLDRRVVIEPPSEYRKLAPVGEIPTERDRATEIREAIRERRLEDAANAYFRLREADTRGVLGSEEALELGAWLASNAHPEAAAVVYRRLIREAPSGPLSARARVALGEILLNELRQPAAAYQYLVDALDLAPPPDVAARAHELLDAIAGMQKLKLGTLRR
ncbi:MAG: rhomboid family intramembrane serine protease [Candidatus Binatia bacterium]